LCGIKWFYNLRHDLTMELLFCNLLLVLSLLVAYINPFGTLTRGGARVLQRLQTRHQGARSAPFGALEPLAFVGLFGAEDLRKVPEFASFSKAFAWPVEEVDGAEDSLEA
ncbi:MAG: hypothetical protein ACM3YO_01255, partial [Bacteroidota bacterium]